MTGNIVNTLKGHQKSVSSVVISPNEKYIISSSQDKSIKIWKLNNGKLVQTLEGHKTGINCVNISPDGKYIISGGGVGFFKRNEIKIWKSKVQSHFIL